MNRSGAFARVAPGVTDVLVSRLAWGMWRFQGDDLARARLSLIHISEPTRPY